MRLLCMVWPSRMQVAGTRLYTFCLVVYPQVYEIIK